MAQEAEKQPEQAGESSETQAREAEKSPEKETRRERKAREQQEQSEESEESRREDKKEKDVDQKQDSDGYMLGVWNATTVEGMGITVSLAEFEQMTGEEMKITFEFKSNGVVTGEAMGEKARGRYTVKGNQIDVTLDDETVEFFYVDGTLQFELEDFVFVLSREGEETPSSSSQNKSGSGTRFDEEQTDKIVGKWYGHTIEAEGITISIKEFTQMTGMKMEISFEFKADGTVIGIVSDDDDNMEETGTYKVNGDRIAVTFDGETEYMTLEGDILVLEMDGMRFLMKK